MPLPWKSARNGSPADWRASKIDHPGGEHDDYANGAAGALYLANKNQAFNPKAVPISIGNNGIGAQIQRTFGATFDQPGPFVEEREEDCDPFSRSSRAVRE